MPGKKVVGRKGGQNKWIVILMVSFLFMAIIAGMAGSIGTVKISLPSQNIPLKSAEDIAIEQQYGPLAPIVKSFQSFVDTVTGDTGDEVLSLIHI